MTKWKPWKSSLVMVHFLVLATAVGCDDEDGDENTGRACAVPEDCYIDIDYSQIVGEIECITRVEDGYCTHLCTSDEECCALSGECETGIPQVCAPFESMEDMRCFLSCEDEDLGDLSSEDYCQIYAHPAFNCRSSGGGSNNRKICVP